MIDPDKAAFQLLCAGNAMVDVFAEVPLDFCKQFSLDAPVQHVNAETASAIYAALPQDRVIKSGGGAANTAKAAARLGIKTAFTGALGSKENQLDPFGALFIKEIEAAGVMPYLVKKLSPTGLFINIRSGNEKHIIASPSAALEFDAQDIDQAMFSVPSSKAVLYLDGFILDRKELVQRFVELAEKHDLTLALDLGTESIASQEAEFIFGKNRSLYTPRQEPLIVFMNQKEAEACAKVFAADWESFFISESRNNPVLIAVKLAEQGAAVFSGGSVYKISVDPLELPDSTGAGDAFAAGFLSAYLQNKDPEQCGISGNAAAAMVLQKIHVLVVDDNPVNLTMALAFLAAFTIEADTALSGAEALTMIEKMHSSGSAYDLVFMDHLMPEMDGIETTKRIRAWEKLQLESTKLPLKTGIPIVLLSANTHDNVKQDCIDAGMNDFISKPLEKEELDKVLRQWLPQDKIRLIQNAAQTDADIIDTNYDPLIKELSGIKGLDVITGLSHAGNNHSAYFNALCQFTENCTGYAEDLNNAVKTENWEAYTIKAHALKGVLAAFGAGRLSQWASNLENTAKLRLKETQPFCTALLDFRDKICNTSLLVWPSDSSADNNTIPDGVIMSDKKIILAVDDMAENLTIMRSILEKYYDARLAKSAKMALDLLTHTPVDLILLDIEMPGMTGFQFLEQLNRKDSPNKDTPVIFVTSHADRDLINKAINAGAKDYIVKPVKAESLYKKINSVFDSCGSKTDPMEENLKALINAASSGDSKQAETLLKEILTLTKSMGGDTHSLMTEIAKLILNFDFERGIRKIETLLHNLSLKKK